MEPRHRDLSDFTFETKTTDAITDADRAALFALFDGAYRDANHAYLEKSFGVLRYLTIATQDGKHAGFALGEMRVLDLPRLPQQPVAMAGICCIDAAFRRRGLFSALEARSLAAAGIAIESGRILRCGRVAHPASFRLMTLDPTHVPKPNVVPTSWQQEVGAAVAAAYRVAEFDPQTFVCRGAGVPIGYPVMDIESTPDEWIVFREVNRDRGDSLLGIAWGPNAPEGWDDP
jgi:hypothetical protein